jgi:glycosyltransferase involved in cell wall biosynthesis
MRILYFTRDYTPHDHRFLSALAQTEHEVHFLRLERRGHALEDRPLTERVRQVHWAGGLGPAGWRDGPRLLADLKRVLRELKPDLVHAGPIQRSAFLAALAGFRPLVSMSWGYDLLQDAERNALWRWATRFTLRRTTVMVGDCETIRQKAAAYGMRRERIVTFPWGIDLEHFTTAAGGQRSSNGGRPFTVLSTRSWEPIYGVDVIARAFVQAAGERPELRLIMLGNGSQAAALRQTFLRAGVADRVFFPGQVSYADLPRYYRSADLYVSASHSDGTSISLLEALACGRAVLASDIPGNREWVTPGEQGWLFPDGAAGALAEGIVQAAGQREKLAEMGQAARRLAEQRANWEENFRYLLKAYEMAIKLHAGVE